MRPVPTWKSTDAAPTPMRDGPSLVPWASRPWQVAQFEAKSFSPSLTLDWLDTAEVVLSSALAVELNSAYAPPVVMRPTTMSDTVAIGERRPFLDLLLVNMRWGVSSSYLRR